MTSWVLLVVLGVLALSGATLWAVLRDGYGWRPPPAVWPEQEEKRTWAR